MRRLVGTGSRHGDALPSRMGDVLRQPLVWAGFAAAISLSGPRGRRAALRGAVCSAIGALIHWPIKRAIGRPRPWGARWMNARASSPSFPSGHTASDLSFVLGASQELPVLLAPLSLATLTSHWSLLRARKHYPSDVLAGGAIAVAVTVAAWKLRPPGGGRSDVRLASFQRSGESRAIAPGRVRAAKRAAMRFVTNRLVNPLTRPLLERGLWPRTQALIETTGRTSGLPRRVPVGNGLRGSSFWIVTEHGYGADYVKNIQREPRMRVKVGRRWYDGTAEILPDDDPRERMRWLGRPVNDAALRLVGTEQLTIRVNLER